ncbi:hypothetical protein EF888_03270 [Silicimonas algicola]|uniref:Arsenate reductase-like glutaredoxin family protein n=1 Tax=Silicimonas algicola TaxID=1826607 RepID=A0A316GGP0_9RHOB|nr:ArsC/Spx/MgsR family protein [Silicimonas algicola]AZQ66237.1 hypothetical protein EF888_03270 [Silicimonas algicola]PWK58550.1 arsenate reductase-like glutaredoxin family protein [Silicimonas algicola]
MVDIFGLRTCDTCRAADKALRAAGLDVTFRDVREAPLSGAEIAALHQAFGDDLVNRRSTSWRGLSEAERAGEPQALLAAHPTLMKRPVIRRGDVLTLGWDAAARAPHLG